MVRTGFKAGEQKLQFAPLMTWPENKFYVINFLMPPIKVNNALRSEKAPDGDSKAQHGQESISSSGYETQD